MGLQLYCICVPPHNNNQMNQSSSLQKLRSTIALLLSSHTRSDLADTKATLKSLLDQPPQSSTQSQSLLEQLLAYSTHSAQLSQFVAYLDQHCDTLSKYSKHINDIIKKYVENRGKSRLDEDSAKQARIVMGRRILEEGGIADWVLEEARRDQGVCAKVLTMVEECFAERGVMGNVSGIVVLCVNLLKVQAKVWTQNLKTSLVILNHLLKSSQIVQKSLIPRIAQYLPLALKSQRAQKQCVNLYTTIIKSNTNQQQVIQSISFIVSYLKSSLPSALSSSSVRLSSSAPSQCLPEQSQSLTQFLQASNCYLKQSEQPEPATTQKQKHRNKNVNVSGLDENKQDRKAKGESMRDGRDGREGIRKELKEELIAISKELLLVMDWASVAGLLEIVMEGREAGDQELLLKQCLMNCMPYDIGTQACTKQQLVLSFVYFWLQHMPTPQKNQLIQQLCLYDPSLCLQEQQPSLTLFLDYIKKTIENQFQFSFNKPSLRSACNLFCYLQPYLNTEHPKGNNQKGENQDQENENDNDNDGKNVDDSKMSSKKKEIVMEIVKMLLNLNQSCEKEYRGFLVREIMRVICAYAKILLPDNQFLREVVQRKLLQNIFEYKNEAYHLATNKLLSDSLISSLLQNLHNGDYLLNSSSEIQFLFEIMLLQNKQKVLSSQISWEWLAYLHTSGVKIYGKEWTWNERELRSVREGKMAMFGVQFQADVQRLAGIGDKDKDRK